MDKEYHDIEVSKLTFSRLVALARIDESDDDIICRLLNEYDEKYK